MSNWQNTILARHVARSVPGREKVQPIDWIKLYRTADARFQADMAAGRALQRHWYGLMRLADWSIDLVRLSRSA